MSTPALLRLREARPDAQITLLTHEKLKDLWQGHPAIDAVKIFKEGEGAWSIGTRLRQQGFDIALVFPNSPRSALEVWLARIPQRIGYARPWRNWLLTQSVPPRAGAISMHKRSVAEINRLNRQGTTASPPPPAAHHIHQYLRLATVLGARAEPVAPKLIVSDGAVSEFVAKFKLPGPAETVPWFGLNAGAEYGPAKRWPEQRFIDAAIEIQRRMKCRWLIFGTKAERESGERIATNISRAAERQFGTEEAAGGPSVVNLAGMTGLGELCAGLKLCRVLLTNDSGPMHMAAAVGTTVVVPFGSTSPELTGPGLPGGDRHQLLRANVPCAPCFLRECPIDFRCMMGISVESVVEAVVKAAC
jgi:lipopolysaccharide heptosyltransferase II